MASASTILPRKLGEKLREKAEEIDSLPDELAVEILFNGLEHHAHLLYDERKTRNIQKLHFIYNKKIWEVKKEKEENENEKNKPDTGSTDCIRRFRHCERRCKRSNRCRTRWQYDSGFRVGYV